MHGVPWSSCLTGSTSVFGALGLGMDQGVLWGWTVRVACLCPLGANSRMVGGAQPSPDGHELLPLCVTIVRCLVLVQVAPGLLALEGLVGCVNVLGSRHHTPHLCCACAGVCLEDASYRCRLARNGAWWA